MKGTGYGASGMVGSEDVTEALIPARLLVVDGAGVAEVGGVRLLATKGVRRLSTLVAKEISRI